MKRKDKKTSNRTAIFSVRADSELVDKFKYICELQKIDLGAAMENMMILYLKKESASALEKAHQMLKVGT